MNYCLLIDSPSSIELNRGLQSGGGWGLFYQLAQTLDIPRSSFHPLYLTFRALTERDYKDMKLKRLKPGKVWFKGIQIPIWLEKSFKDLDAKIGKLPPDTILLCVGSLCQFYLIKEPSLMKYRGSWASVAVNNTIRSFISTLHPDILLGKYEWHTLVLADLLRLKRGYTKRIAAQEHIVAPTAEAAIKYLSEEAPAVLSLDIETYQKKISSIALAPSPDFAFVIPFSKLANAEGSPNNTVLPYFSASDEVRVIAALRTYLMKVKTLIGQNFIFDLHFLFREYLFFPNRVFDTMLAAHVFSCTQKKDLATSCSLYLPHYRYWKDDKKGEDDDSSVVFAGSPNMWKYNALDAMNTYELAKELQVLIKEANLTEQLKYQNRSINALIRMMFRGVRIDKDVRDSYVSTMKMYVNKAIAYVKTATGIPTLNLESPKQLCDYFYKQLKLPEQEHFKRHNVTTDSDALDRLAVIEPLVRPLTQSINFVRSMSGNIATASMPLTLSDRTTCFYNPGGTETYRLSSRVNPFGEGTNLQNITKGDEKATNWLNWAPNLRKILTPDKNFIAFEGDLSRADLYVVVWEAGDAELKQRLKTGVDMHVASAMDIFRIENPEKVTPEQRQKAKAGVHATNYGVYAKTLAKTLGITVKAAEAFILAWLTAHPDIAVWQERIKTQLETTRTVSNIFGYRLKWDGRIDYHAHSVALAWGPQSTVAIYTQRIMLALDSCPELSHKYFHLLMQTHDSLGFQIHKDAISDYLPIIQAKSKIIAPYDDPLIIPFEIKQMKRSWGDSGDDAKTVT